jgi:hypothetical protein
MNQSTEAMAAPSVNGLAVLRVDRTAVRTSEHIVSIWRHLIKGKPKWGLFRDIC